MDPLRISFWTQIYRETKFRHEGTRTQRNPEEPGNSQTANLFMNFFVPEPVPE
jgi:hypothetical protein